MRFGWPSAANKYLRLVQLVRRTGRNAGPLAADPTACLTTALGAGKKEVVDFASGASETSWALGKRGDRVVLRGPSLDIVARDGATVDEPPDWVEHYPKVMGALATCARDGGG